ncbi:hypothetical protein LUCX_197 [Xanthomonas phage vB_XciM_LucasX]|nr:hypothetical protein LUCX_197 [Xanthomonas phage vB_XciM_LucasX]
MLFEQLPPWALAALMLISCAVKHMGVKRLAHTRWFQRMFRERRWYLAVLMAAAIGAIGTWLIFGKFVGCLYAMTFAAADFLVHVNAGCVARRIKLYDLDPPIYLMWISLLRTFHVFAYLIFIGLTMVRL